MADSVLIFSPCLEALPGMVDLAHVHYNLAEEVGRGRRPGGGATECTTERGCPKRAWGELYKV